MPYFIFTIIAFILVVIGASAGILLSSVFKPKQKKDKQIKEIPTENTKLFIFESPSKLKFPYNVHVRKIVGPDSPEFKLVQVGEKTLTLAL